MAEKLSPFAIAAEIVKSQIKTQADAVTGNPEAIRSIADKEIENLRRAQQIREDIKKRVFPKEPEIIPGKPALTAFKNIPRVLGETAIEGLPIAPLEIGAALGIAKAVPAAIKAIPTGSILKKPIQLFPKPIKKVPIDSKKISGDIVKELAGKEVKPTPTQPIKKTEGPTFIPKKAEGLAKERGFIKTIKDSPLTDAVVKARLEGQYIPKSNDALIRKANLRIKQNPAEALDFASNNVSDDAVATSVELIKKFQNEGNFEAAINLATKAASRATEQGRSIQALSIYNRLSPQGIVRAAQKRLVQIDPKAKLKPEDAKRLFKMAEELDGIPDSINKSIKTNDLLKQIDQLAVSSLPKRAVAVWKAGLLTGLKTSELNTLSNAAHGLTRILGRPIAVGVDSVASLFTGKRTVGLLDPKTYSKGMGEGFNKAVRFVRTGFDERNLLNKYDHHQTSFGNSPVAKGIQAYEETVFKIIGGQDQPFYYGAKAASHGEQGSAIAMNMAKANKLPKGKGFLLMKDQLKPKEFLKLRGKSPKEIEKILQKNPTDKMVNNAANDAQVSVYQDETLLGNIGSAAQKASVAAEVVFPFTRTPSAVIMRSLNYSPVGVAKAIVTNIGKGKWNQRDFSLLMGEGIIGTGVMAVGAHLKKNDMMTLGFPKTQREREQWALEGRRPNSIFVPEGVPVIGGRWVNPLVLGPPGISLLMGAHFQENYEKFGSKTQAMAATLAGLGKTVVDQSFLAGASTILKAFEDPERWGTKLLGRYVGSAIPTLVADAAKAIDGKERSTYAPGDDIKTFTNTMKARIPFLSKDLPVRKDVFGKEIEPSAKGALSMIDVFRSQLKRGQDDNTIKELERLSKTEELIATPIKIQNKNNIANVEFEIPFEQLDTINARAGVDTKKVYDDVIKGSFYKTSSDEEKSVVLKKISSDIKRVNKLWYAEENNVLPKEQIDLMVAKMPIEQMNYYSSGEYQFIPKVSTQQIFAKELLNFFSNR